MPRRSTVSATASVASPVPSRARRGVGERDRRELARAVDGRGRRDRPHRARRASTTNTPSSPSVVAAVTTIESAATASGTCAFVAVERHDRRRRRTVAGCSPRRRPARERDGADRARRTRARAGDAARSSSVAGQRDEARRRRPRVDANGPGCTARPSSSSTTAMSTMPMPAPPCASGTSRPVDAEVGEPSPHVVGRAALVVEHLAHVRDRCALGEEPAHRSREQLLILAELEVQGLPDCNELRSAAVRLRVRRRGRGVPAPS